MILQPSNPTHPIHLSTLDHHNARLVERNPNVFGLAHIAVQWKQISNGEKQIDSPTYSDKL